MTSSKDLFRQEKVFIFTYSFFFIFHSFPFFIPEVWLLSDFFIITGIPFFIFNNIPYSINIYVLNIIYLSIYLFIYLSIYLFAKAIVKKNLLLRRRLFYLILYVFYTINHLYLELGFWGVPTFGSSFIMTFPIIIIYIFDVERGFIKNVFIYIKSRFGKQDVDDNNNH
jgi:hypothetical protein